MLAAQHILGGYIGLAGVALLVTGLLLNPRAFHRWPFIVPGLVLLAAAGWLVTR